MRSRSATASDLDQVIVTLTGAFAGDPLWRWAFPDLDDLEVVWRFMLTSALRYPWLRILDDCTAAASWIPPGGTELTEQEDVELQRMVPDRVVELLHRFEAAHPYDRPHYYLSLLGTHPDHRGKGLGMALLAEALTRIDALGAAAYLESTNPVNNERYMNAGFEPRAEITMPSGRIVTTMWRPAR